MVRRVLIGISLLALCWFSPWLAAGVAGLRVLCRAGRERGAGWGIVIAGWSAAVLAGLIWPVVPELHHPRGLGAAAVLLLASVVTVAAPAASYPELTEEAVPGRATTGDFRPAARATDARSTSGSTKAA